MAKQKFWNMEWYKVGIGKDSHIKSNVVCNPEMYKPEFWRDLK